MPELLRQLPPVQLGVGVSGGCEAAAHTVRAFAKSPVVPGDNVLVKLDMENALNTVRRYHFVHQISLFIKSPINSSLSIDSVRHEQPSCDW